MGTIAITGCGAVYGHFLQSPRILRVGLGLPVGEVPLTNDELKARLGIDVASPISRTALLGAIAARQAIEQAGFDKGKRVAFLSGTTVGGMDVTEQHFSEMLSDASAASLILQHGCGANTEQIAALCGIEPDSICCISTACSSALNAIIQGAQMLLADECDVAIAGGAEALTCFHLLGFNSLKILDSSPCKPFDATRQGLNLGEGAGYVVLQRTETARKPLAYIAGYGNRCDAFHQTATSENGEGAFLAMTDALRMANLNPSDIDYVNAHGTGTPDNDRSESAALRRVFGSEMPPVSSTKSVTGHTTSASGGIETVICLQAMAEGVIPANANWHTQDEACITPVSKPTHAALHNVVCNSFGFGGNDSSLIISDAPHNLPEIKLKEIHAIGSYAITDTVSLSELNAYVPPIERRRMSTLMKAATLTSMKALEQANVTTPDAIIIATRYGMLEQGEKILEHIDTFGEEGLSPTLFMQSTHNTLAGSLAIRLKCYGWNMTYSCEADSLPQAMAEARRIISEGKAKNILVGEHDFCPEGFLQRLEMAGKKPESTLISRSFVITAND